MVHTVYALLQFLLLVSEEEYNYTLFFIGIDAIREDVYENLPNYILFDDTKYKSRKKTFWLRIYKWLYWNKCIEHATFYCQDHLYFPSIVIGHKKYNLLEDGSQIYSRYKGGPLAHIVPCSDLIDWITRAPIYGKTLGRNSQCNTIYYTYAGDAASDIVINRKNEHIFLQEMWNDSSITKQKAINYIYNISEQLLFRLGCAETIILTDSMVTNQVLSEQELIEIYKPYIDKDVVIKKHPIDVVDYKKYFPHAIICEGYIPMQLLTLNHIAFKRAITMFSTAVSLFDESTEIIWLGNAGNVKVKKVFGDCPNPFIKNK